MKVAVALLFDQQQRILTTQRPFHSEHGGYWEFPGGKLEFGELPEQALIREIREEVGLMVDECEFIGEIHHNYPKKSVDLLVFHVVRFFGEPRCLERQLSMKWIKREELNIKHFPEANQKIFFMIDCLFEEKTI